MSNFQKIKAFTLVELSIVIVIIGLIIGGVTAGMGLVRSAQLRSIATDFSSYQSAIFSFRGQYNALPGDLTNAEAYWGTANVVNATCAITNSGGKATCNGNGDRRIDRATLRSNEQFRFWQHLANANLIPGIYSGIAGPTDSYDAVPGINVPKSKLTDATWYLYGVYWNSVGSSFFDGYYDAVLQFGTQAGGTDNAAPVLTPAEAYNIDTKLDDGRPGKGRIMIRNWVTCTDAANSAAINSNYLLSSSAKGCTLVFLKLW